MTTFTCIMTTYNDGPILRQSIQSVLGQTHEDIQFLLVDDGSAAETQAIAAEFDDPRLTVLPQANDGLSSARNRGLFHARGDYVCFLDGDDVRAPWAMAEAAEVIEKQDAPELIFVGGVFSGERTVLKPFFDDPLLQAYTAALAAGEPDDLSSRKGWAAGFEPQSANKYVSRDLIERAALRFPNDHFFEDILFHSMAIAHAKSIEILTGTHHFTYFQRALRPQITGGSGTTRFDILGTARVTLQMFQMHPDFSNARQRSAVMIGVLRLLHWCEGTISAYHRHAFRLALREILTSIDPLYLILPPDTPDPRNEKDRLLSFVEWVMA